MHVRRCSSWAQRKSFRWVVLLIGTTMWPATTSGAEELTIGFVLYSTPGWIVLIDGAQKSIAAGDKLMPGAVVRPPKDRTDPRLQLCLYDGTTVEYSVEKALPFRKKGVATHRIVSAVAGRYRGNTDLDAKRGSEHLTDGVLLIDDASIDLAPLFADLPEGTWTFRVQKAGAVDQKKPKDESQVLTVSAKWSAGEAAPIQAANLTPGLYEFQLVNPRTKRPLEPSVVALVSNAGTFHEYAKQYENAVALTETWDAEIRDHTAEPFLRAFLEQLGNSAEKSR